MICTEERRQVDRIEKKNCRIADVSCPWWIKWDIRFPAIAHVYVCVYSDEKLVRSEGLEPPTF